MKIESTGPSALTAMKIVVAAEAGNGKTTLASTIEPVLGEKVLVISAEAGLLSLQGKNVDYVELQSRWDEAKGISVPVPKEQRIDRLREILVHVMKPETQAKYKWLFIDSLTEINQNVLEMLEANPDFQGGSNTIKKYGELATRMRSLAKAFRDLPHYNVVFSALVKQENNSDGIPVMKIDMTGKFADQLPSLFDEIFYLGVMADVDDQGRNVRTILTQKTDRILFPKDRSGTLSRSEPADLGLIAKKIRRGQTMVVAPITAKTEVKPEAKKEEEKTA